MRRKLTGPARQMLRVSTVSPVQSVSSMSASYSIDRVDAETSFSRYGGSRTTSLVAGHPPAAVLLALDASLSSL